MLTTAAALFLLGCGDVLADWHEVSSDHFVIYADESEKKIRKYSDRLERYYSAMTFVLPCVTIFVVGNERIVRKLYGESASRNLLGFTCRARAAHSRSSRRSTSRAVARRPSRSWC
jgi:hypothetical protein